MQESSWLWHMLGLLYVNKNVCSKLKFYDILFQNGIRENFLNAAIHKHFVINKQVVSDIYQSFIRPLL